MPGVKWACFDVSKRNRYLGCLRKGMRHGEACRAANASRTSVWGYINAHPEFKEEVDRAEADYCDRVEKYLLKAIRTKLNLPAMIFWLTNRHPERWQDRRATSKVEINAGKATDGPTAAELLQQIEDLAKNDQPNA